MNNQDFESGKRAILRELVGVAGLSVRVDRCEAGGVSMLRVTMSRKGLTPVVRRIATKVDRPILTMLQCDAARLARDVMFSPERAEALVRNTITCVESNVPPKITEAGTFAVALWQSGARALRVAFSSYRPHCHVTTTEENVIVAGPLTVKAVKSRSGFEVVPPDAIRPLVDWVYQKDELSTGGRSAVGFHGDFVLRESGWFSRSEIANLLK
jgi:hypothetical protein